MNCIILLWGVGWLGQPLFGRKIWMVGMAVCSMTERTGMSVTAISHIMGNGPGIGPTAEGGMVRMVSQLKCHPGTITEKLTDGGAAAINMVVPSVSDAFFTRLTENVRSVTAVCGCGVVLDGSSRGVRGRLRLLGAVLKGRISKVIFVNNGVASRRIRRFRGSPIPVMLTNSVRRANGVPSMGVGCRRTTFSIAGSFVRGNRGSTTVIIKPLHRPVGRRGGLTNCGQTLRRTRITFHSRLIIRKSCACSSNVRTFRGLLRTSPHPATVFTKSSRVTLKVIRKTRSGKCGVPGSFRIVDSSGAELTLVIHPRLASIIRPLCSVNTITVELLAGLVGGRSISRRVIMLPRQVRRQDSAGW